MLATCFQNKFNWIVPKQHFSLFFPRPYTKRECRSSLRSEKRDYHTSPYDKIVPPCFFGLRACRSVGASQIRRYLFLHIPFRGFFAPTSRVYIASPHSVLEHCYGPLKRFLATHITFAGSETVMPYPNCWVTLPHGPTDLADGWSLACFVAFNGDPHFPVVAWICA